jgi:hypothetical protein
LPLLKRILHCLAFIPKVKGVMHREEEAPIAPTGTPVTREKEE